MSIPECGTDMIVGVNEFDGKVVYGEKRNKSGKDYDCVVIILVARLHSVESTVPH